LPLSGGAERLVLAIERNASDDCLDEREVENLAVYSCLAGVALDRARTAMALQETAAREAAMLGAIGDSVIALDRAGTVRMLNEPAAAALRIGRDEIVGRVLREVPGLEPLAFVLGGAPELVADPISLPHGRFAIRPEVYPGGVVATIRDLSVEPTAGQRARRPVRYTFQHSVGEDPALVQVLENAKRAAQLDLPVLISGESGTGKEVLAQAIHRASPRASAPFVGINVIAIPRDLLESELFGYEGGAFTGARSSGRAGRFEEAGRGTLLLDEIGDMPLEMQGKLLRVLEERTVQRVGGAREVPVLARVIASTNCDLEEAVKAGRFRLDLFHRLRVVHLHLPALRERRGDVRLLVEHHLRLHAQRVHGRAVTVAPHVLAAMEAHDWPGNVRELLNLVDSELALLPAGKNTLSVIPSALRRPAPTSSTGPSASARSTEGEAVPLAEIVRRACEHALARHGGNVASAARELGIAKGTLYSKTVRRTRPEIADLQPASRPAREKPER
jgi:transcriptional regulator with PAS, ATPase and Fis domain